MEAATIIETDGPRLTNGPDQGGRDDPRALLALLNLAGAALIAERRRAGWLIALAAQIPWTLFDLWTRQPGFLLLTLIYVPVYVRGGGKRETRPARR